MPDNDFNACILEHRIGGLLGSHPEWFAGLRGIERRKGAALTLLSMKALLGLDLSEAADLLAEDESHDLGVDGIDHWELDGGLSVTLFQARCDPDGLSGSACYPEDGVRQAVAAVQAILDPDRETPGDARPGPAIEEIRSMVRDGVIPNVRMVLCSNGRRWNEIAEQDIRNARFPEDQVSFVFFNHDDIVGMLRSHRRIDDAIQLQGKAIVENFNYRRVLIGKVPVVQIAELFDRYDDLLLERNIRRCLGLHSNRVNSAIHRTLCSDRKREDFYFFNNGITMICDQFRYDALQEENFKLQLTGMRIVDGGQTCRTIQRTLRERPELLGRMNNTFVMLRIYELARDEADFVQDITFAANSQNPVDLRDLHSNDPIQRNLEIGLEQLGVSYRRKREEGTGAPDSIPSSLAAEAVLAIWRRRPHQARTMRREHFGRLYSLIFSDLNAAQVMIAVGILRFVEAERRHPGLAPHDFLPYASHYIAMRIGILLLRENDLAAGDLDHRNYRRIAESWNANKDRLYVAATGDVDTALRGFYGGRTDLSLQQLAATFRRGDFLVSLTL